jgi:hypothetical protein
MTCLTSRSRSGTPRTIQVFDQIDTSKNPIFNGPLNPWRTSDRIQYWAGSDGNGNVVVQGALSPISRQTIGSDGYTFDD